MEKTAEGGMRRMAGMMIFSGEQLRAIAFPLGGIGTGQVALCGDGGLRQWQIFNNINHRAHVPLSFFGVWIRQERARPLARVLQSSARYGDIFEPAPSVSDHEVPEASRRLLQQLPGVEDTRFVGEYPVAEIEYIIPTSPVRLSLQAYSPFVPLEPDDSGLPAIIFHFKLTNPTSSRVNASILMTQQNAIGWDGLTEINGISHPGYGGNRNRLIRRPGATAIELTNSSLPDDHPANGEMAIATIGGAGSTHAIQWTDLKLLWNDFSRDGRLDGSKRNAPSARGKTVNAALADMVSVEPESEARFTFLLTWYFPNRYVDWDQPTLEHDKDLKRSRLWLGNQYASQFDSAVGVAEYVRDNLGRFDAVVTRFREALYDSSLPAPLIEAASSQISVVRSPTCFRAADGRFYGFEGCCGASTEMIGDKGGCCPLNCTHVWNYAMTVSRLFPQLECSMRETEWLHQQHESGYLPHRVVVPLSLRRPWGRWIGGPPYPAIDGLLGAILKTYREFRICGDTTWLVSFWNHIRLAIEHVMKRYDRGDGVINGPQPCTYDVQIEGSNSFIETLYLASLRAAEEMATAVGDAESATTYRERFRQGRKAADRLLWEGEYYVHRFDPESESVQAYGKGCHADQLFGQWWAHSLGLGYVLPRGRVRRALASIVTHNLRKDFSKHQQFPRKYVCDHETGMLNCTWPKGGRPDTPLLYSDEVWTGIEYEVAGALLFEGMVDEALALVAAVRKRQDGRLRSPWNEVECGDHYVRAMSSWTLLEAATGYLYDASKNLIEFGPRISAEDFKCFFITCSGWGRYAQRLRGKKLTVRLSVSWGNVRVRELRLSRNGVQNAERLVAQIGRERIPLTARTGSGKVVVKFKKLIVLDKDQELKISIG